MGIRDESTEWMAITALNLIDLRAEFQAQLRTLTHAEEQLRKCRSSATDTAFRECVAAFREDVATMSKNNVAIRDVLDGITSETRVLDKSPGQAT